ncbi:MAG TPA: thioesterase family protein [Burkholderiaceae bacterium]|jgi:acyl-CoA thioesterase|nr:thioesterase family protein [Burkholderiaceae bacterium]
MSQFDDEIRLTTIGTGAYEGRVDPAWNIGANPNGGYLLTLALSALRQAAPEHPDPVSVTVHYLRPGVPGQPCRIDTQVLRTGRTLSTVRATLTQDGLPRLEVLAALGDLTDSTQATATIAPPAMPPPDQCPPRPGPEQGLDLSIVGRLEIRLHPDEVHAVAGGRAQVTGWIRFRDGRPPDTLAGVLFADTFPPSVFGQIGMAGWVPTVELTVHVRRRPAEGWMLGQFRTHDLTDGRLIEDGLLWDCAGNLIVQSRQLALVRQGGRKL